VVGWGGGCGVLVVVGLCWLVGVGVCECLFVVGWGGLCGACVCVGFLWFVGCWGWCVLVGVVVVFWCGLFCCWWVFVVCVVGVCLVFFVFGWYLVFVGLVFVWGWVGVGCFLFVVVCLCVGGVGVLWLCLGVGVFLCVLWCGCGVVGVGRVGVWGWCCLECILLGFWYW
jgi:hypothetical protein